MVKFGDSRLEKKSEETSLEVEKKGAEKKPVWYRTWWGILIAIFLLFLLICGGVKPKWVKIEVSNCYVALVSMGFTYLFLLVLRWRQRVLKIIFGLIWLLFLPNTAYLFTDLAHIIYQWNTVAPSGHMLLLVQYILLELFGITAFLFSFLPFEVVIDRLKLFKKRKVTCLILSNFLVAYGLVLGRFEHINSWILFTNPLKVFSLAINIFMSFDLLELTILFGLLCNVVYFLFRGLLLQKTSEYFHILDY